MNQGVPHRVSVPTQKIAELVFEKIFPAMNGQPTDAMVLSLICAAALAMRPSLEMEKLQKIIVDVSGYLITQLQDEVKPEDVN